MKYSEKVGFFFWQIDLILKNDKCNFDFFHLFGKILFILDRKFLIRFHCNGESVMIHFNFHIFRGIFINICACKPQPTPEPPKQCQELEGYLCISDKKCGKGGHCIRDG